jgi:hypothetical protein
VVTQGRAHLFEFMDQGWVPVSLRVTLRRILERANGRPFRTYYRWVAREVLAAGVAGGAVELAELGAGTAPVTRELLRQGCPAGMRLTPCDLTPDVPAYRRLEAQAGAQVVPCYEAVDFTRPRAWSSDAVLYLSATFHHVAPEARPAVLAALAGCGARVLVFEPLRRNVASMVFVFFSIVPALLLPLLEIRRGRFLQDALWCWVVPVAPLMFVWDGLASCWRMWTDEEWRAALAGVLGEERRYTVESRGFCQRVSW